MKFVSTILILFGLIGGIFFGPIPTQAQFDKTYSNCDSVECSTNAPINISCDDLSPLEMTIHHAEYKNGLLKANFTNASSQLKKVKDNQSTIVSNFSPIVLQSLQLKVSNACKLTLLKLEPPGWKTLSWRSRKQHSPTLQ